MPTWRAERKTWVASVVIWSPLVIIGLLHCLLKGNCQFPVLWLGLAGGGLSAFFVSRYRLRIDDGCLEFRGVFGSRRIQISEIEAVSFSRSGYLAFRPAYAIVLSSKRGVRFNVIINPKPFSSDSMRQAFEALEKSGIPIVF